MLTVRDVATRLNLSRQCVYSLIRGGKLKAYRIGTGRGAIRVSEEDLSRFLAACRESTTAEPKRVRRPSLKHINL